MASVAFSLFKKHVRADEFSDDDEYLHHLLDTAEESVVTMTRRTLGELTALGHGEIPRPIIHAIMMLGAHWYNQRESVSVGQMTEVPEALQALVKPYVKLTNDSRENEV